MSPDARQRIVHELISFKGPLTTVVTVGELPPKLMNKPEKEWTAKNVANAILADKATGRVASGQKISLAEVDNAVKEEGRRDDVLLLRVYFAKLAKLEEGEATTYRRERDRDRGRFACRWYEHARRFWTKWTRSSAIYSRILLRRAPRKKYRKPGDEGLDILHCLINNNTL